MASIFSPFLSPAHRSFIIMMERGVCARARYVSIGEKIYSPILPDKSARDLTSLHHSRVGAL